MVSEGLEPLLASANKALKLKKITAFGFWITLILGFVNPLFFVLTVLFAVIFIYVNTKGVIKLDYSIEEDQQSNVNLRMNPMIRITECSKVWRIRKLARSLIENILVVQAILLIELLVLQQQKLLSRLRQMFKLLLSKQEKKL